VATEQIEVYISYRWEGASVALADDLQACLTAPPHRFKVLRDNTEVMYKGDLARYMAQLSNGRFVIVILSDGYLRSQHCMRELVTLYGHADFRNRIFPIVLPDANIRTPGGKMAYKAHWEARKAAFQVEYNALEDKTGSGALLEVLDLFDAIQDRTLEILIFIDNLNTLSPEALQAKQWEVLRKAITDQAAVHALADSARFPASVQVSGKLRLNPAFKFACDRTEQFTKFKEVRQGGCKPARFLFLPGEELQSHIGFAQRMKLELEGEFLQTKQRELDCMLLPLLYPEPVNQDYDIANLLADLLDKLGLDPDDFTPIQARRFGKLLQESPSTTPLFGNDLVLLNISINDFDLNYDHVAKTITWFNQQFFELGAFAAQAPDVIVLWSVLFTSTPEADAARLLLRSLCDAHADFRLLPELQPIEAQHLKRWLQRHAIGLPADQHDPWIQSQLKGQKSLPMSYVESALENLITRLNNGEIQAL
jgi:hypothetical protein